MSDSEQSGVAKKRRRRRGARKHRGKHGNAVSGTEQQGETAQDGAAQRSEGEQGGGGTPSKPRRSRRRTSLTRSGDGTPAGVRLGKRRRDENTPSRSRKRQAISPLSSRVWRHSQGVGGVGKLERPSAPKNSSQSIMERASTQYYRPRVRREQLSVESPSHIIEGLDLDSYGSMSRNMQYGDHSQLLAELSGEGGKHGADEEHGTLLRDVREMVVQSEDADAIANLITIVGVLHQKLVSMARSVWSEEGATSGAHMQREEANGEMHSSRQEEWSGGSRSSVEDASDEAQREEIAEEWFKQMGIPMSLDDVLDRPAAVERYADDSPQVPLFNSH